MSEGMPNEGSVYAREGSAAHEVGEMALRSGYDAIHYLGVTIPDYPEVIVDETMCAAVQEYLDTVRGEIARYETETGLDDWEMGVEVRFDLTHVYANMFGTCDCTLFFPAWKRLVVLDYKHGWLSVPVERNPQTMYYAIGAVSGKHNRDVEEIELVIVQPRSGHHTIVKRWSCGMEELLDFRAVLVDSARRTESPTARLNPGEWCKFCPAAPVCRVLSNRIAELVMAKENPITGITMPDPDKLTDTELYEVWRNAGMIQSWVKNITSYVHYRSTKENRPLPGTKVIEGRSNRKWKDEQDAIKGLKGLIAMGELEGSIFTTELKSPAQIEDMLPKKAKGTIKKLWKKGYGTLTVVPDTDDRGAAKVDATKEF